jgi:hypothetical protein
MFKMDYQMYFIIQYHDLYMDMHDIQTKYLINISAYFLRTLAVI